MSEKFTFFWRGPFSQWRRSKFIVDELTYATAEQYMMAGKARLFGDKDSERLILENDSPKEQKALGRKVKNFVKNVWDQHARDIVYHGNYAKFTQNADLKEVLLTTSGTTLVEASPVDNIWGIGLAEDDPRALDRASWLGTNWLGEVLTKVRDDIIAKVVTTENFNWTN